ncbi:hypothetical protein [Carboxylicivirga sp. RSCT41]
MIPIEIFLVTVAVIVSGTILLAGLETINQYKPKLLNCFLMV